jgi:hypothetical protein
VTSSSWYSGEEGIRDHHGQEDEGLPCVTMPHNRSKLQEKAGLYPWTCFFFFFFFYGAGIKPRASLMLGKRCATELHPSPLDMLWFLSRQCLISN